MIVAMKIKKTKQLYGLFLHVVLSTFPVAMQLENIVEDVSQERCNFINV